MPFPPPPLHSPPAQPHWAAFVGAAKEEISSNTKRRNDATTICLPSTGRSSPQFASTSPSASPSPTSFPSAYPTPSSAPSSYLSGRQSGPHACPVACSIAVVLVLFPFYFLSVFVLFLFLFLFFAWLRPRRQLEF